MRRLDPLSKGFRRLAVLAGLALAAAGITASAVIRREEAVLSEAAFRRTAWDASQTWAEWLRLQASVGRAGVLGSDEALDELDLRIGIVRSRLRSDILPSLEAVWSPGEVASLRARLDDGLDSAAALAREPGDPAAARRAIEQLASASAALGRLASDAHVADTDRLTAARGNLATLQEAFFGIVLLAVACGLGLIALLAHNNRRLRAERGGRELAERRVDLAMDASGAGWWSRVGDQFQLSARARDMVGLPVGEGEVHLEALRSLVHPDDSSAVDGAPPELMLANGDFVNSFRVLHPERGTRWISIMGHAEPASGSVPRRSHGIAIDETGRKALEDELRLAKDAAESAVAAKSRMLASASHDLRQPLQSMFLVAAALEGEADPRRRAELSRLLDQGMLTLKALLDSVVEVARIESGSTTPIVADFSLSAMVAEIEGAYAPRAAGKGIAFRIRGCGVAVRSDRTLLGRMLRNLVENALRYTERGSVEIACVPVGGSVRIEVRDSGVGIPEDKIDLIWEEFQQVGNSHRDRSEGLGLGLAIVRMLGKTLDHPVDVRSVPGRGSTFSVTVPIGEETLPERPAAAPAATDGRCVAVVDDDPLVLAALGAALASAGYRVLPAGSGEEAVAAIRASGERPGFIVADYRLRGETGTAALAKVRAALGVRVPAAILTGEVGEEAAADAARHGVELVEKPVPVAALVERIERTAAAA